MRDTPRSQSAQYLRASMYEVLGIAPTASDEEVHAAYRRVVKRAHPDAGGSQRAFLRVNAAYRVLSDPGMRRAHDLWLAHLLDAYDQPGRTGGGRSPGGRTPPSGRHPADGRPGSDGRTNPGGRTTPGGQADNPGQVAPGNRGTSDDRTPPAGGAAPGRRGASGRASDQWGPGQGADTAGGWGEAGGWGSAGDWGEAAADPRSAEGRAPGGRGGPDRRAHPGPRGVSGGRRRSRRRPPADAAEWVVPPGQATAPDGGPAGPPPYEVTGGAETWATWSDEDHLRRDLGRRAQRRYLVSMALCLTLFVLAGAVVRLYSIPVALGMMLASMVIPPLAVLAVNAARRR
ncbi:DnaJ domain-containing protein [Parafrankia discariae]|uniref:DnaJ domain-containing protein n=1 Tax=Parafrankia discariae TaxID=365528 RepID=UPI000477EEA8|nr:DnaJ domain-containing protein [Parafrankia discariae]